MRPFTARTGVGLALTLALLAAGLTGCSRAKTEQAEATEMGAAMQRNGVMSQADYVRIRALGHQTSRTHAMSEADLDWTLGLLQRSGSGIARARALTTLSEIRPMSAAQKAKIAPAIRPYLSSPNRLDQVGAQRVQKAIDAGG